VKSPHSLLKIDPNKKFKTYIDGCSFTSGMPGTYGNTWSSFINNAYNNAVAGKDNFSIFNDTFYVINNYDIDRIIIYWTYPERFWLPTKERDKITNWSNKMIQPCFTVDKCFFDYVKMNLNFMYVLQEHCKNRNIECFYLTTVPYYLYEEGDNGLVNKIRGVGNWPGPYLNKNYNVWVNSLQILFGGFYNCVDKDGMHLNSRGHKLFYEKVIEPLINHNEIDQQWSSQSVVNWVESLSLEDRNEAFKNARIKDTLLNSNTTGFVYEQN